MRDLLPVGHERAEDSFRIAANPLERAVPLDLRRLNKEAVSKLEKLFDIAYVLAKLDVTFTSDPQLCQLEQNHGIGRGKVRELIRLPRIL